MPLIDEMIAPDGMFPAGEAGSEAQAPAAPPPPPAPSKSFGPYTGPPKEQTTTSATTTETAEAPDPATARLPLPGYRIGGNVIAGRDEMEAMAPLRASRDPNRIVWRWFHVLIFGVLAWAVPFAVDWWLGIDRSIEALLNRSLAVQIVGYLLAALSVAAFVWTRQDGDWSTLGLGEDAHKGRLDALRGVGFGLAIFLGYLPVGLFTNGRTSLDPMVSLLLGSSNGMGLVLTGAVVVIGAPVVEEIFFRGVLYEKLARRSTQVAIVVTGILFMLVHGAIVLQILVLGLVFALKRSKGESVWYTIGAHSAWNASVLVVGVLVLTGSAVEFTPSSNLYELRYERDWERQEELEMSVVTGTIDLALLSANGSMMSVIEFPDTPALRRIGSSQFIEQMPTNMTGATGAATNVSLEPVSFPGASQAYEITATIPIMGVTLDYEMVALQPDGSDSLLVFMLACPDVSCDAASGDFDAMMETVEFL
jgi:membrane protease YdiL (CAAX protease family)